MRHAVTAVDPDLAQHAVQCNVFAALSTTVAPTAGFGLQLFDSHSDKLPLIQVGEASTQ
jgi:hypothetical protein